MSIEAAAVSLGQLIPNGVIEAAEAVEKESSRTGQSVDATERFEGAVPLGGLGRLHGGEVLADRVLNVRLARVGRVSLDGLAQIGRLPF